MFIFSRPLRCALLFVALLAPAAAKAAPADAREVARLNNCPPKKIEVMKHSLGEEGATIYRVSCNLPKAKDENAPKTADAVLINCQANICEFLRAVILEDK